MWITLNYIDFTNVAKQTFNSLQNDIQYNNNSKKQFVIQIDSNSCIEFVFLSDLLRENRIIDKQGFVELYTQRLIEGNIV